MAIRSEQITEGLPWPVVYYPNHYGAFFAFAAYEATEPWLCSCCEPAVSNLLRLMESAGFNYGDQLKMAPLSSRFFPDRIASMSLGHSHALGAVRFRPDLCHRCRRAKPTLRYCHEMYGSAFTQHYGWYINQVYLRSGILPISLVYLSDTCPPEYQRVIERPREVHRSLENEARREFGFPEVGEGSVGETLLFDVVRRLFSSEDVLRHYQPAWLQGLELDIFVPRFGIGIEYQGIQHFQPVQHWGGQETLARQKERDRRKARLCEAAGVHLITFAYHEDLNDLFVKNRVAETVARSTIAVNSSRRINRGKAVQSHQHGVDHVDVAATSRPARERESVTIDEPFHLFDPGVRTAHEA